MMFQWVQHGGERLYDVGVLPDGSLHNPNGYPDDSVRAAVQAAEFIRQQRRSLAAKKAAETRRRRTVKKVHDTAMKTVQGQQLGPRPNCCICGRGLGDPVSITRGIGSECWQDVLSALEMKRAAQRPTIDSGPCLLFEILPVED